MKILFKLWNGDFSLTKTYWLFHVLIWNLIFLPIVLWTETSQSTRHSYLLLGLFFSILFISYGCIVLFGLWRSANKYKGWWLWSSLAKVIDVLGILFILTSIVGAFQNNLIAGLILLLSAIATLTLFKFYEMKASSKTIKLSIVGFVALFAILLISLLLSKHSFSLNKSNWMPLLKFEALSQPNEKVSETIIYLDFNSITKKNEFKYANVASEFYKDGKFDKTIVHGYEFICSSPKLRIVTLTKFSNKLSDGFGQKLEEDLNFQATQAKFLTSNGKIYSGGWKTYDDMQENFSKYCIDTAESDKRFYNYLCSVTKQDIAITKSVCESN